MAIEIVGLLDKTGEEEVQTKNGVETRYYIVIKLKKIAYEKGTENIKEGTGDPWTTQKITTLNRDNISEYYSKQKGEEVTIIVK